MCFIFKNVTQVTVVNFAANKHSVSYVNNKVNLKWGQITTVHVDDAVDMLK
jgi:hypothetical protein